MTRAAVQWRAGERVHASVPHGTLALSRKYAGRKKLYPVRASASGPLLASLLRNFFHISSAFSSALHFTVPYHTTHTGAVCCGAAAVSHP